MSLVGRMHKPYSNSRSPPIETVVIDIPIELHGIALTSRNRKLKAFRTHLIARWILTESVYGRYRLRVNSNFRVVAGTNTQLPAGIYGYFTEDGLITASDLYGQRDHSLPHSQCGSVGLAVPVQIYRNDAFAIPPVLAMVRLQFCQKLAAGRESKCWEKHQ